MAGPYPPAPDNRTVNGPNPPGDNNSNSDAIAIVQAVLAQMAGFPGNGTIPAGNTANATALQTIVGTFMGPGLAPSGGDDTTNIQNLLNLAGMAPLQAAQFNYSAPLTVPTNGGLICPLAAQSFGDPGADYGVGGLALSGCILKASDTFADADASTGTIYMTSPNGVQGGSQRLEAITLDLSNTPDGNNLHGILIQNNTACVTLRDVTVYGGSGQLGGDCLHAVASLYSPPDLVRLEDCHFVGGTGGVTMTGVADSYVSICESTGNTNYAWNITNCNNTRFLGCKGETSTAGPGWLFTANSGFTGIVHLALCTAQSNFGDGWKFTGTGTGTYQMIACSDDGSGVNGGSGGGGYSGMNVTSFGGIVLADGFNVRVSGTTTSPEYGVSMTSSNTVVIGTGNIAGQTSAFNNGGGNTIFQGPSGSGGFIITPVQYAPTTLSTLTAAGTTYAPLLPAATTVAAGSNGGEISGVATWAHPSAGVLDVATGGVSAWPAAGTFTVATSTTPATCTYTGIGSGGSSLTGVAYVSGSATGTVATGGAVTPVSPSAINTGSFVAPPSGSVVIEISLLIEQLTATTICSFGLAAKGTVTPIVGNLINMAPANDNASTAPTVLQYYVTGLTAGTAYSFDLIAATNSGSDAINVAAQSITSTTFNDARGAPVLATVRAV